MHSQPSTWGLQKCARRRRSCNNVKRNWRPPRSTSGRTEIRAPVDGVVIKRSVDVGQTVAASLQAPELFVIAKDLRDMQVDTSIDEADVGRIRVGQKASFTVDAFPGRTFNGEVRACARRRRARRTS